MRTVLVEKQDMDDVIEYLLKAEFTISGCADHLFRGNDKEDILKGVEEAEDKIFDALQILKKYNMPYLFKNKSRNKNIIRIYP